MDEEEIGDECDVIIEPPDVHQLTDEDSDNEDLVNPSGNQLFV